MIEDAQEVARSREEVAETLVLHHREFLGFLERRIGSREAAEDVLQEAFARGLDRLATLRSEESAVAWFYRVLRNAVIDRVRRGGAVDRRLEAYAHQLRAVEQPPQADLDMACHCVGRLLDTLKPEYAHALRRIEMDGLPVKAYAAETGITPNNAAVRVHRAREALRRQVADSCSTCAEHGCLDCSCAPQE